MLRRSLPRDVCLIGVAWCTVCDGVLKRMWRALTDPLWGYWGCSRSPHGDAFTPSCLAHNPAHTHGNAISTLMCRSFLSTTMSSWRHQTLVLDIPKTLSSGCSVDVLMVFSSTSFVLGRGNSFFLPVSRRGNPSIWRKLREYSGRLLRDHSEVLTGMPYGSHRQPE